MTPVDSKVSLLEISSIFVAPRPKISIRSFWPTCDQNRRSHFDVRQNGSNFQIFALEREFCSEHDASSLESIPPGNFTHFCRPTPENFDSVFLTVVRVNGGFDRRATKIHVWSF